MRLENPALLSEGRISNEKTHGVLTASSGQDTKADHGTTIGSHLMPMTRTRHARRRP
jgi:hypothetical protein